MVTNIEDLKLEEITEDFLRENMIDMGAALGVDTRQGSIYRDAGEGHTFRTAKFFNDLRQVVGILSIDSCTGDVLDEQLSIRGLSRNPPEDTPATYYAEFVGAEPEEGARVICEEHFFTAHLLDSGEWTVVSEETGTEMNNIAPGAIIVPERDIDELKSAAIIGLAIPAVNRESDDDARRRLHNKLGGPDENGNKSQFKTWCESVEGVGRARIIPLWNGPYTVMGVIIDRYGKTPTEKIVSDVQEYVDPGCTGMGEGVASIGQFFTAVAAEAVVIDVKVSILKKTDATYSGIEADFKELLNDYFTRLSLEDYSDKMSVRIAHIGALLDGMEAVIDYDGLTLNGGASNIPFTIYQIPVVREVIVDGNIQ